MQQVTTSPRKDTLFTATCVIYLVILLSFIALRTVASTGWLEFLPGWAFDIGFSLITQVVLMTIVPIVGIIIYNKKFNKAPKTFAEFTATNYSSSGTKEIFNSWWFKKPSANLLMWAILLGVLCFFFNLFVSQFFNGFLALFGHRGAMGGMGGAPTFVGIGGLFVMLFITAVLPGFCEEVTHRGFLIRGFASKIGIINAISLSSVLFGLMHLNIVQVFFATILGWLMALAMVATRNIWVAIIIHFMNNAAAVYFTFASRYDWFMGDFFSVLGNFLGGLNFIFYIAVFIGIYIAIVAIIHKFARDNFIKDNLTKEIPLPMHRSRGMAAIKYYISADEVKNKEILNPLERTLICGILFLGIVVTGMTLVWGFL